jgi:hypothetical protein
MNFHRRHLNWLPNWQLKSRRRSNTLKGSQRMGGRQNYLKNLRTSSFNKDLSNETKCWDVYKVGLVEKVKEKEWHCATKPLKGPSSQVRIF